MSKVAPLPSWLRVKLPGGPDYDRIKGYMKEKPLATVCEEAKCPNIAECWSGGTATFMVLGDTCTRGCRFCSVSTSAKPGLPDPNEPRHLSETLSGMGLEYAVITTVCRDDLADQGAGHIADCIDAVKARTPGLLIEILVQDFRGNSSALKTVLSAKPDVLAHNIETVERLSPGVRDSKAGYRQSLNVLAASRRLAPKTPTKSSIMLGLGETEEELITAFKDLRAVGVAILTLGQYLRPTGSARHLPVKEFVAPERFDALGELARSMGFLYVASGPFVRSSYRAGELFLKGMLAKSVPAQEAPHGIIDCR